MRSKLPKRVHVVKLLARLANGARDLDRKSEPLGRRLRAQGIPMSSCTRQLPGRVRKSLLVHQKWSLRLVLNSLMRATQISSIILVIIICVILEWMISNEYYMIAYEHLKLCIVLVLLDHPYFALARSGSSLLCLHIDRNCAMHKISRVHWSKNQGYTL